MKIKDRDTGDQDDYIMGIDVGYGPDAQVFRRQYLGSWGLLKHRTAEIYRQNPCGIPSRNSATVSTNQSPDVKLKPSPAIGISPCVIGNCGT